MIMKVFNPLYLQVNHANKYLIFDSADENNDILKKNTQIDAINSCECDYEKDFMKIKFTSDDDLPLDKPLKFHMMTIISDLFLKKMVNFIHKFFQMALYMSEVYKNILLQRTYKMVEYDRIDIL